MKELLGEPLIGGDGVVEYVIDDFNVLLRWIDWEICPERYYEKNSLEDSMRIARDCIQNSYVEEKKGDILEVMEVKLISYSRRWNEK